METSPQTGPVVNCPACNLAMEDLGDIPFRTGGTRGAWKLLIGEWAELGEGLLNLDVYVCRTCGRVQLFADRRTRDSMKMRT